MACFVLFIECGEEDVDVVMVGAGAHHSGEVDVVFGIPLDDGLYGARGRQVVLVFDDVDAASQGDGITRNNDNAVFTKAGGSAKAGLFFLNLATSCGPFIGSRVVDDDVSTTIAVRFVGRDGVGKANAAVREVHRDVLGSGVGVPIVVRVVEGLLAVEISSRHARLTADILHDFIADGHFFGGYGSAGVVFQHAFHLREASSGYEQGQC